ncbi:Monothiol glutaredoxin-S4, partial [Mucuna pruriens]
MDSVVQMASEKQVVIFSRSSCCMCHTIKTLFSDFGVHPNVHELDEIPRGKDIEQALSRLGCSPSVPAVFIGGELVGGANEVMSLHLNRSLIPMLRRAGALWVKKKEISRNSLQLGHGPQLWYIFSPIDQYYFKYIHLKSQDRQCTK